MTVLPEVLRCCCFGRVGSRAATAPASCNHRLRSRRRCGRAARARVAETIVVLGEFEIAFLLFTLGLEFSFPQFVAIRRTVIVLGGLQVGAGTFSGASSPGCSACPCRRH